MAFKFKYENILKIRLDQEEAAKHAFAFASQALALAKDNLNQTLRDFDTYKRDWQTRMAQGLKANDFVFFQANKRYFENEIISLKQEVRNKELALIDKRVALVEATQERKKYEKLKEQALKAFGALEQKQEAEISDQIVTYHASERLKGRG